MTQVVMRNIEKINNTRYNSAIGKCLLIQRKEEIRWNIWMLSKNVKLNHHFVEYEWIGRTKVNSFPRFIFAKKTPTHESYINYDVNIF